MGSSYTHLEERGRYIFRADYQKADEEKNFQRQELVQDILQMFQKMKSPVSEKEGENRNTEDILVLVRRAVLHGIFLEAIELSKKQERVSRGGVSQNFPVRHAVNTSREEVESLLETFNTKNSRIVMDSVQKLVEKSLEETDIFRKQAEESIMRHRESQIARKKTETRLTEAIKKFQNDHYDLLRKQKVLEKEKTELLVERNRFAEEIEKNKLEKLKARQKEDEFSRVLREKNIALEWANKRIKAIEIELEQGKKEKEILGKISTELQSVAKDGENETERLHSLLEEVRTLRKQQEIYAVKDSSYERLLNKLSEIESLNETLVQDMEEQKKLTAQASIVSLLDKNLNTDEHIIEAYYHALEEYFAVVLHEYPKDFKDHSLLDNSAAKLREMFFIVRSRWADPIETGRKRLREISETWKTREGSQKYDTSPVTVTQIHKEIIRFLETLTQNKKAIHAYTTVANANE